MPDPYTTLGVKRDASADDIKKAYRKLAHQHHPDKKGGNEARFKEINEAYQVLSDPDKKARYDRFGDAGQQAGFGGFGGGGSQDVHFDFGGMGGGFENIFDMFSGGFGAARGKPDKGEDLQLHISVGQKDLGKQKVYEYEAFVSCKDCDATGAKNSRMISCTDCNGQGRVRRAVRTPMGTFAQVVVCPKCSGDGRVPEHVCDVCSGTGRLKKKRTLEVHIPSRIDERYLIVFPAEGNAGLEGVPAGDLLVTLQVK